MCVLSVLSVLSGDRDITVDPVNAPEKADAAKAEISTLLKRGASILIEVGVINGEPIYQRVKSYDPEGPDSAGTFLIAGEVPVDSDTEGATVEKTPKKKGRPRKRTTSKVSAAKAKGVVVAPTAGG